MYRKAYFSEIHFTNSFYIDGVNVLEDKNRRCIGKISVDLNMRLSFSKIENASLYEIDGKDFSFKVAIAKVRDFYIICYMDSMTFSKVQRNRVVASESKLLNRKELLNLALNKIKKDEIHIYSSDNLYRASIKEEESGIQVIYEVLTIEDEQSFYFYESISSDNFFFWDQLSEVSYFESLENAQKEIDINLKTLGSRRYEDVFYWGNEIEDTELWRFHHSKRFVFLYQLKYILVALALILVIGAAMAITQITNWYIMVLFGGVDLFTLAVSMLALKNNGLLINYRITEKMIMLFDGISHNIKYSDIKEIKMKKNLHNKHSGTIIIKRKNKIFKYRIIQIPETNKVYEIIMKQINSQMDS